MNISICSAHLDIIAGFLAAVISRFLALRGVYTEQIALTLAGLGPSIAAMQLRRDIHSHMEMRSIARPLFALVTPVCEIISTLSLSPASERFALPHHRIWPL